jgi:virginiamycin B lyase
MPSFGVRPLRPCWPVLVLSIAGGLAGQTITEFRHSPPLYLEGSIVAGPDGALWFTQDYPEAGIWRITTAGEFTEFRSPGVGNTVYIAKGPDGALWFTQVFSTIGRIDTAGSFTLFPGTASTAGIAAGPDGAIWFTTVITNSSFFYQIGRLATNGSVSFFPLPGPANINASGAPGAIVSGPDGALWFTLPDSSRIGRITTSGSVTEFPIPSGRRPGSIIAGPDGALWFTEGTAIGRITTSGAVTEFPVPDVSSITAGPDGALWFTESFLNKIGRMTITGVVSEFSTPNPPGDITTGPDGALWFTESSGAIGRLALSPQAVATSVPALSAWGLVILGVLLAGWSTLVMTKAFRART